MSSRLRRAPGKAAARLLHDGDVVVSSRATASRMYYHGTKEEVRLGDRVRIRRLLCKDLEGTVAYIPGLSAPHPELEFEDVRQWAIKLKDGTVLAMAYDPDHRLGQPRSDLVLVGRSNDPGINPSEKLE